MDALCQQVAVQVLELDALIHLEGQNVADLTDRHEVFGGDTGPI